MVPGWRTNVSLDKRGKNVKCEIYTSPTDFKKKEEETYPNARSTAFKISESEYNRNIIKDVIFSFYIQNNNLPSTLYAPSI